MQPNNNGDTPLHLVARFQTPDATLAVLKVFGNQAKTLAAEPDDTGSTLLHLAAYAGQLGNVRHLLQIGIDPRIQNRDAKTATQLAQEQNHEAIVNYLWHFKQPLPSHLQLTRERSVMVRVWPPKSNKKETSLKKALFGSGDTNIGHVSISIRDGSNETYISHWPEEVPSIPIFSVAGTQNTLSQDHNCEGGLPKVQIVLYGLDTTKMIARFKEIGAQVRWFIGGSNTTGKFKPATRDNKDISHSCSSFVYELLMLGGIFEHLLAKKEQLSNPITPNEIGELAQKAQAIEHILYPETQTFFAEDLAAFKEQLIQHSNNGFQALNAFVEQQPDYHSLYAAHRPQDTQPLMKALQINIKRSAARILLGFVQSVSERDLAVFNNMFLPQIKRLIQKGADLSWRDKKGYNALHWAILNESPCLVEYLLITFPDAINSEVFPPSNSNSSTFFSSEKSEKRPPTISPLELAQDQGNETIIKLLEASLKREISSNFIKTSHP